MPSSSHKDITTPNSCHDDNALRVLIIDDNPADVLLTKEALTHNSFDASVIIDSANDCEIASDMLNQRDSYTDYKRPDLILLDINMPKKNGHEVLDDIKSSKSLKSIPVIMMSSSESENDITQSYKLHANSYISKPKNINQYHKIGNAIIGFWFSIASLSKQTTIPNS